MKNLDELQRQADKRETKRINDIWEKIMAGEVKEYSWGMEGQESIGNYNVLGNEIRKERRRGY